MDDPAAEYGRMADKYGMHPKIELSVVEKVFGNERTFRSCMRDFAAGRIPDFLKDDDGEDGEKAIADMTCRRTARDARHARRQIPAQSDSRAKLEEIAVEAQAAGRISDVRRSLCNAGNAAREAPGPFGLRGFGRCGRRRTYRCSTDFCRTRRRCSTGRTIGCACAITRLSRSAHPQRSIDYPTAANPERIKAISVLRGGVWRSAVAARHQAGRITPIRRSSPSWPQKWEPYEQIEIFPQTDQSYSLRIFYIKNLSASRKTDDTSDIDDLLDLHRRRVFRKGALPPAGRAALQRRVGRPAREAEGEELVAEQIQSERLRRANRYVKPQTTSTLGY
jgi:hypothetical protein